MSFGPLAVYSDTIASGASTSGGVLLKRAYSAVSVQVGTMSTATVISVQASADEGATYRNIFSVPPATATVANSFTIATSVGTGGGICVIPAGFNAYRFVLTAVVSGGVSFKVICSSP